MHEGNVPVPEELSVNDAVIQIKAMLNEIYSTGAYDTEPSALEIIIGKVKRGVLSPREGVEKALALLSSRQNYH